LGNAGAITNYTHASGLTANVAGGHFKAGWSSTTATDDAGNVTTVVADLAGRTDSSSDPNAGQSVFTYDPNGNVTSTISVLSDLVLPTPIAPPAPCFDFIDCLLRGLTPSSPGAPSTVPVCDEACKLEKLMADPLEMSMSDLLQLQADLSRLLLTEGVPSSFVVACIGGGGGAGSVVGFQGCFMTNGLQGYGLGTVSRGIGTPVY